MAQFQLKDKDLLDIRAVIEFGTRAPEDYSILFYKEVYSSDKKVRIRGLSTFEYDQIAVEMFSEIKDAETIRYVFNNPKKKDDGEKEQDELESVDEELPDSVNASEITNAYALRVVLIVHYAMRDFYKDLTITDVKQIEGLDEIANRVDEKSGRTPEIVEKIKFFRKQWRERHSQVPDKKGT